jgi:enamine deaminase RidA (YjgF/YER057c/UK114 family)
MSTSIVTELDHTEAMIGVELDATFARKEFVHAPTVWSSPGGPHALKIGNTIYVQATMARQLDGRTMFPGDIVGQANLSFKNLDGILKAAGVRWNDVVHIRTYCKRREDIGAIRAVRDKWLPVGHYASAAVVTKFLDLELLIEIEVIAVTG